MPDRHITSLLPPPVEARTSGDDLSIGLPEGGSEQFSLLYIPSLTLRSVNEVLREEEASRPRRVFVSYQRSSRDAREALRAAGIAFAGADGRLFVRAPGILIEREEPRRLKEDWELEVPSVVPLRNPFSKRSSRVPRWLLLHHAKTFFLSELADAVNLNPATTSRVVRALEDAGFVSEPEPSAHGRRKHVRLDRSRQLLDAWLPYWQKRPIRQRRWDVGARDADDALRLVEMAVKDRADRFAIGGLAGAATLSRAVEPADVLVWTTAEEATDLAEVLQPVPSRGGRGTVRVAVAPDPWTLGLARKKNGLLIADAVQLWLDCACEGERALEAAEAVAGAVGWQ